MRKNQTGKEGKFFKNTSLGWLPLEAAGSLFPRGAVRNHVKHPQLYQPETGQRLIVLAHYKKGHKGCSTHRNK